MTKYAPLLLLVGGALHAVPYLNSLITDIGGGGIIQITVGILSVLAGITLIRGSEQVQTSI